MTFVFDRARVEFAIADLRRRQVAAVDPEERARRTRELNHLLEKLRDEAFCD